ncbi:MAG: hypothetical protein HQK66_10595 [Desulfamplus sp.]|nr:hypothetical protein [Desulfamplus sp.]
MPGTCVLPGGRFIVGIHRPTFKVNILRKNDFIHTLGTLPDGTPVENSTNFPRDEVEEPCADLIYEIPNPLPFRGVTYINSKWADSKAGRPESIYIHPSPRVSMKSLIDPWIKSLLSCLRENAKLSKNIAENIAENIAIDSAHVRKMHSELIKILPRPLLLALGESSTDPEDLILLASLCCQFLYDETSENNQDDSGADDDGNSCFLKNPRGIQFIMDSHGVPRPAITDHELFEVVANNTHLPDSYKQAMVLVPGIQGSSEITGEWQDNRSHVFEYLRRNSYIPWGHFAANTAHDTVRYAIRQLDDNDMAGMRHLYYQRTYIRVARELQNRGITFPSMPFLQGNSKKRLSLGEIETLRCHIVDILTKNWTDQVTDSGNPFPGLIFNASLWGWNFGFGYAHSGYRLHASHQQIHQQYAMVPAEVEICSDNILSTMPPMDGRYEISQALHGKMPSFSCGDMVGDFVKNYREATGENFFECYIKAVRSNQRVDGKKGLPSPLIVYEDDNVMLFVPKAQTSQWELQLMPIKECGNILAADTAMRNSLDNGILKALQILEKMGARMVTSIEYAGRFDHGNGDERILYSFLPRIPQSPGAFSEAQLRWINGHYPEDFASACRLSMQS